MTSTSRPPTALSDPCASTDGQIVALRMRSQPIRMPATVVPTTMSASPSIPGRAKS